MAGAALIPMRSGSDPTSRQPADAQAPPARAGYEAAVAEIWAATTAVSPLLPLASLPGRLGAGRPGGRAARPGARPGRLRRRPPGGHRGARAPLHTLLFAAPASACGSWPASSSSRGARRRRGAASSPGLELRACPPRWRSASAWSPSLRLSPLHEGALRASRRSAALWARRAVPGWRGTLAVGWAHGVASVGAGAGLVGRARPRRGRPALGAGRRAPAARRARAPARGTGRRGRPGGCCSR